MLWACSVVATILTTTPCNISPPLLHHYCSLLVTNSCGQRIRVYLDLVFPSFTSFHSTYKCDLLAFAFFSDFSHIRWLFFCCCCSPLSSETMSWTLYYFPRALELFSFIGCQKLLCTEHRWAQNILHSCFLSYWKIDSLLDHGIAL